MAEPVKPRRYDSPRRRAQAAETRRADPRGGRAPVRAPGLRGHDDVGDRRRGRRRAEDGLRGVRDQERRAARALAPASARRPGGRPDPRARLVPRGAGRARPGARAAAGRARGSAGQGARRRAVRRAAQRRRRRSGHRGAVEPDRVGVLREPARGRRRARAACAPGLDVTRAADIMWTLNHPDVWELLVGGRGWTPDEWEEWFAATLSAQLLGEATRSPSAAGRLPDHGLRSRRREGHLPRPVQQPPPGQEVAAQEEAAADARSP